MRRDMNETGIADHRRKTGKAEEKGEISQGGGVDGPKRPIRGGGDVRSGASGVGVRDCGLAASATRQCTHISRAGQHARRHCAHAGGLLAGGSAGTGAAVGADAGGRFVGGKTRHPDGASCGEASAYGAGGGGCSYAGDGVSCACPPT
jgi:hypothetical protein